MEDLEKRQSQLKEQRKKLEEFKEENQQARVEQQNATKQIRDFHIKRFWRSWWKPEMDEYENQVKKDEEERKAHDRALDEELEETKTELVDVIAQKAKLQEEIEELKGKDSHEFWKNTLEAEGLLSAEAEVKEKDEQLAILQHQLLEAVRKTGLVNPNQAAEVIATHEAFKTVLSEARAASRFAAGRMKNLIRNSKAVHDSGHTVAGFAKGLRSLHEAHEAQIQFRKKSMSRQQALDLASAASFLDPDLNRTFTA